MNKLDKDSVIGISALLVQAANIDEIYSEQEKDLVKKQIKRSELNPILINTKEQKDVNFLKNKIIENLNQNFSNNLIITNSRHYSALSLAKKEINNVKEGLKNNIPSDLLTVDLKQVLYHLGEVTGEVTNDEVLSNIFSRFCIGK